MRKVVCFQAYKHAEKVEQLGHMSGRTLLFTFGGSGFSYLSNPSFLCWLRKAEAGKRVITEHVKW